MSINKMNSKRLEMIAEVARLYYDEGKNVKEISTLFEISPSTVSRMLQKARELKLVQVVIRYPFLSMPSLSERLESQFGLDEAYVLPDHGSTYNELTKRVGQLAARVLEEHLKDGMVLGVSLGLAVACTERAFHVTEPIHCTVVRLHGANDDELMEGSNLAQLFSARLGNQFKIIPSPFIMQNRVSCEMILSEPSVQEAKRFAETSDIALVGIGSLDPKGSTMLRNQLVTEQELEDLRKAGAVGEICGKFFNSQGEILEIDLNRRTVSIDLQKLSQIPYVIGVAAGAAKVEPILGAIHGRLINILVTESETARQLLGEKTALSI